MRVRVCMCVMPACVLLGGEKNNVAFPMQTLEESGSIEHEETNTEMGEMLRQVKKIYRSKRKIDEGRIIEI